jgi:hypothetical protein
MVDPEIQLFYMAKTLRNQHLKKHGHLDLGSEHKPAGKFFLEETPQYESIVCQTRC